MSSEQKRALLANMLRARESSLESTSLPRANEGVATRSASELPIVEPAPDELHEPFPLTDIQYAYWIGRQGLLGAKPVGAHWYVELELPFVLPSTLDDAVNALIERHPMLRMVTTSDGMQRILPEVSRYSIAITDFRSRPEAEVDAALRSHRERMSHHLYQPECWPLFDVRAFTIGEASTIVCLSGEMLAFDLRSAQIIAQDVVELLMAPETSTPRPAISFRDYVLAERAQRGSALYARSREYWMKRLASLPPPPQLPRQKDACDLRAIQFSRRSATIAADRWQRLRDMATARGLTPAVVLLSAFGHVVATWTGSRRFTLNLTMFNRLPLHPDVDRIVGDFTGTSLLEFDLDGEANFEQRSNKLNAQMWRDLEHRHVTGVQVLRELAREQGARWLVSPVVFTSHISSARGANDSIPVKLPLKLRYGISQTPQVWLDHQVIELAGELIMNWDVVDELFPPGMIDAMFETNVALVHALIDEPEAWDTVRFPSPPESQLRMRRTLNDTRTPGVETLLHEPFFARAKKTPDALAVITDERSLTYVELAARSQALARELNALSIGHGALVPVVMEKGWEQVVAVLGVLQAGAAYVPVDASWPRERISLLLSSTGARAAITQARLLNGLPMLDGLHWIHVRSDAPGSAAEPLGVERVQQSSLAYVIYTSGSTGTPKGVMIDHRGAANTIQDVNQRFEVRCEDRVLALSALSFDLSVYDIFGTLAAGAAIVMPHHGGRRDPVHWLTLAKRHGVTIWNSVPALLRMLIDGNAEHATLESLRLIMLSGDWIAPQLARHARTAWPSARLVGLGGATEASIWSIAHEVDEVPADSRAIPYGRPMANQTIHVLDNKLEPCPDWVPGELYIGGRGVAMGYYGDAELTASRFLAHRKLADRLYRTGDLGRASPHGYFEILGRVDRQIKLRGHRIEPGEIESVLMKHPQVREAVVTVHSNQLCAYVVPDAPMIKADRTELTPDMLEAAAVADKLRPIATGDAELDDSLALLTGPGLRERFKEEAKHRRHAMPRATRLMLTSADAASSLEGRRSARRFSLQPVANTIFAGLLCALQRDSAADGRHPYGSAGASFPVELYALVKAGAVEGIARGLYRYDAVDSVLELIDDVPRDLRRLFTPVINRPLYDEAAAALFLVADLAAVAPLYGDRSVHFSTLEAGAMAHVLESAAARLGLGICQVGDLEAAAISEVLQLGRTQRYLHCIVVGSKETVADDVRTPTVFDAREEQVLARALERVRALEEERVVEILAERAKEAAPR